MFANCRPIRIAAFILTLLVGVGPVWAEDVNSQYIRIHSIIDEADLLEKNGKPDAANVKYRAAHAALLKLRQENPTWNVKMVSFRLNYLAGKITALSQPAPAPVEANVPVTSPATKPERKASPLPPGVQVKLLSAGAAPRKFLYMQARPGEKQTLVMTAKSAMGMGAGGAQVEMMKTPSMKMTVSALPGSVSAEGDIQYELRIEDIQVVAEAGSPPEVVEGMKKSLESVKGLSIQCVATDRGFIKKAEATIPAGTDAVTKEAMKEMEESFASADFLLPKEAIGAGAKWEVRQKVKTEGMLVDQMATHQLISIEGDILTVKSSITESAANQKVPNPMTPELKADLVKMTDLSAVSMKVDLAKILPLEGTIEEHSESIIAADAGGQKQTMTIKSDTNVRMESK